MYESGVATVKIIHRSGKLNTNADALSRSPLNSTLGRDLGQGEVQVSQVTAEPRSQTLGATQVPLGSEDSAFGDEQRKDVDLLEIITFLETAELPADDKRARKVALQSSMFTMEGGILYFIDAKRGNRKRVVAPQHKRCDLIDETHRGLFGGHFSGDRVYHTLTRHWWWEGMYGDLLKTTWSCPECVIATGVGRVRRLLCIPFPCPVHSRSGRLTSWIC